MSKATPFVVYNGSVAETGGLAKKAKAALSSAGFSKGQVNTSPPPNGRSGTTHVYYATSAQKPTAEAIVSALGVGTVKLNATVAAQGIVVVVGDDYKG